MTRVIATSLASTSPRQRWLRCCPLSVVQRGGEDLVDNAAGENSDDATPKVAQMASSDSEGEERVMEHG